MKMVYFNTLILSITLFFSGCKKEGNLDQQIEENDTIGQIEDTITDNPIDTIVDPIIDSNYVDPIIDTTIIDSIENNYYVYVSLYSENKIAILKIDTLNGKLSKIENIQTNGRPGSLSHSKNKQYLYAALRSTNQVASYKIDTKTGLLRLINNTNVVDNPVYIAPDRTNKYLLSAYYAGNKIAVYPLIGDSIIDEKATQVLEPGINPHCILNDEDNAFTYVAVMTGGNVCQYSYNSNTGILSPLSPDKLELGENIGPRHILFHPNKKWVYIVNEIENTVYTYQKNSDGTLTKIDEIGTLPESFTDYSKCADIHVTPNGKYVYASNRGHNSIAAFSIDQSNGHLALIDQYETEPYPREFEIDKTGRFLYAGGESSGKLAVYSINENGTLTLIETYSVGVNISWVMVISLEN